MWVQQVAWLFYLFFFIIKKYKIIGLPNWVQQNNMYVSFFFLHNLEYFFLVGFSLAQT